MTAAAVAEATGGAEPAGAQRGQRTRQQPARFGVADMELSAAHVRRFDQSWGSRHERLPERPCQRAERAQTEAEAATEAAGKAQRQLAQARRRLRQAQERAQAEAQIRAAMAQSRLPRQRQSRQPPLQQPPQQPQRGVRTLFNDLASVMDEANLFADGVYCDMDDALPPLPEDFGSQEFYA